MKMFIKYSSICLFLLLMTNCSNAQTYFNLYPATDAVLLQIDSVSQIESRISGAFITLSDDLNQLNVRLNIPSHSINNQPEVNPVFSPGLLFDLKVNVNPNEIQEYLTSTRKFTTYGSLTLNNITRQVIVEYMPLLVGTNMNGDFNVFMNIQFDPAEFNLDESYNESKFIIKISDARVSRV